MRLPLLVSALLCAACAPEPPPNVLIISIDTLRRDHVGIHGYARQTSPAIDRFAGRGAIFEDAHAAGPATVESHASLFTGRFPHQHGAYSSIWTALGEEEVTLAEMLAQEGYETFAVTSSVRFDPRFHFDQGFESYVNVDSLDKNVRSRAVTALALQMLRREREGPFFGFLHYLGPHEPYDPPEPFRSAFGQGAPSLLPGGPGGFVRDHRQPGSTVSPEALAYLEALYDGEILFLDRELRRVFRALDALGLEESTLVILLSDHGEEFREHGGLSHAHSLYHELLRIPLVMRWPGRIDAGMRIDRPAHLVDVVPTVLELVGASPRPGLPGRSLVPDLEGAAAPPGLDVLLAERQPGSWSVTASLEEGRFKLIVEKGALPRLFRLDRDPQERSEVSSRYPEARLRLESIAAEHPGLVGPLAERPAPALPAELRRRLRDIGYTDEGGAPVRP